MNIKFSNIKIKAARLFLFIFSTFLVISFAHSHNFRYLISDNSKIFSEQQKYSLDPLLDSSLNCTIHTFSNSINNFKSLDSQIPYLNLISSVNLIDTKFVITVILFNSNQHRVPPQK